MKARFIGTDIGTMDTLTQPGDVAVGAENYNHEIMVNCPVCGELHIVDPNRWVWNQATLTISPSVLTHWTNGVTGQTQTCHWNLTNGEFLIHPDSTIPPVRR